MHGVIIVSHRGPYAFTEEPDGTLLARRGAGGVVSALQPLLEGGFETDALTWIAAAIGPGDRIAARTDAGRLPGVDLVLLDLPEDEHRLHYDVVSNEVLWFLHHGLFHLTGITDLGPEFVAAWDAYRSVNQQFADAVCARAEPREVVFVQDYQLALVAAMVQEQRPDLRTLFFSHIPFCEPQELEILPEAIRDEYLRALGTVAVGFHTELWADAYRSCMGTVIGNLEPAVFVEPLGPDPAALQDALATPEADTARAWLRDRTTGQRCIVRADRVEPTKNLTRGFEAYAAVLAADPSLIGQVVFVACCYRSRESIPLYRAYAKEVQETVDRINEQFGTSEWTPIIFDVRDDHARSMAALEAADVLLVNPLRDGLNLVVMEGPVVSTRDVVVVCSREAGAYGVMRDGVLGVNPLDVDDTATALLRALTMSDGERSALAEHARSAARRHSPETWLRGCLAHVSP